MTMNIFKRLGRPSTRWSIFSLVSLGFFLGVIGLLGFETTLEATSTESFCLGCHEMADNAYVTYQNTVHDQNRTGVQATCPDCHLPKEFLPKMARKISALREVWGHMNGVIDTPEKFAEHLPRMQEKEIARMRASDSRECRNCHAVDKMAASLQSRVAQASHRALENNSRTCIDCHVGIAHRALTPVDAVP